MAYTGRVGPII